MNKKDAINELKTYIPKDNGYNTKDIEAFNIAISALENIDNLEEEFNKFQEEYELLSKDFIMVCEENENKWFLCSEKLPEENGMYLTTYFRKMKEDFVYPKEEIVVKITRFLNGEWKMPVFIDPEIEKAIYQKIIAWQPLTNPFKESEAQND